MQFFNKNLLKLLFRDERPADVKVFMPKFKVKDRTKLKNLMQAAGIRQVFNIFMLQFRLNIYRET